MSDMQSAIERALQAERELYVKLSALIALWHGESFAAYARTIQAFDDLERAQATLAVSLDALTAIMM